MLGEIHCLVNDFPEMEAVVVKLTEADSTFAKKNERYDALDKEIRELELNDSPTTDDAMHLLKQERATLKDQLYQMLKSAK